MSRVAIAVLALVAGCGRGPELSLDIRLPADTHGLLAAVATLQLSATRDGRVLANASFAGNASFVSISGVGHGPRTIVALDGLDAATPADVIGAGRTCPVDFEESGTRAPLYFAPTNFFAPTLGAPLAMRSDPVVVPLDDGDVLFAGGGDPTSELFSPGTSRFSSAMPQLNQPRQLAETVLVPGVGALITGGIDAQGAPIADAEIFDATLAQFQPLANVLLDARVGHRAVTLPDGRVLVTGGRGTTTLGTTVYVRLQKGPTVQPGPPLVTPRSDHAAVVAVGGVPVVIGGYAGDGTPLASIEALQPANNGMPEAFATIGALQSARAEATASLLDDGSVLVVGGVGAGGVVRADAELYNPFLQTTQVFPLAAARRGHTATLLPDGRVLVVGGFGADGQPLSSVELFDTSIVKFGYVGFVTERPLGTPRAGHVAVPLCDGTVLVVGGAPGAELYTPPSS